MPINSRSQYAREPNDTEVAMIVTEVRAAAREVCQQMVPSLRQAVYECLNLVYDCRMPGGDARPVERLVRTQRRRELNP